MKKVIISAAAMSIVSGVFAADLDLTAWVRDFSSRSSTAFYNPNFQKPGAISGLETGIVQTTLVAKTPTFNNPPLVAVPGGGPSSVTTAADFNEWWAPGVDGAPNNAPFPITMSFDLTNVENVPGGQLCTYTFGDTSFFPINGAGSAGGVPSQATGGYYGNEGRGNNFGFTLAINSTFLYDSAAATSLSFEGDDDLWVFIDNKLVLDLGGVHPPASGGFTLSGASTDVDGNPLNLVDGQTYDIDFYFAERHTARSSFEAELVLFKPVPETNAMGPSLALVAGMAVMALRRRRAAKA